VLLALLLCAVPACGRDDRAASSGPRASDTTTTVPFEQWPTSLDEAGTALNARYVALPDAQPTDAQDAVDYAAQADRFVRATAEAVDDGGVPAGHRAQAEDLAAQLRELSRATRELSAAAVDGDATRATTAAAKVHELAASVDPVAEALGVPACGGF
jgi:hypothetical protein